MFIRYTATFLKVLPLGIYLRSAACKFGLPVLGCDGPLCPVAIGQPATGEMAGCSPTANTAEVRAWCEHAWTPWLNGLLSATPFSATCTEPTGYVLLNVLGALLVVGYLLLWVYPKIGALSLTVFMSFALHFHLTFLKDPPANLGLQFALLGSSAAVLVLEMLPTKPSAKQPSATQPSAKQPSAKQPSAKKTH